MKIEEFNTLLSTIDNIMPFPLYLKRINDFTYNINSNIIDDYLLMYGKNKPCINGANIYNYKERIDIIAKASVSTLIRKNNLIEGIDYVIKNREYILSPTAYFILIRSLNDRDIIDQFYKVFIYGDSYNSYIRLKK
jgi:hypothetical protein